MTPEQDQPIEVRLQNKLRQILPRVERYQQSGEPYITLTEVTSALSSFQTGIALKIQNGVAANEDFRLATGGYGLEPGVVIKNISLSQLQEYQFARFPIKDITSSGVFREGGGLTY